jgi:hypothetical protein
VRASVAPMHANVDALKAMMEPSHRLAVSMIQATGKEAHQPLELSRSAQTPQARGRCPPMNQGQSNRRNAAERLREQAAHARRLAGMIAGDEAASRLEGVAKEWEAEADNVAAQEPAAASEASGSRLRGSRTRQDLE